MEASVGSLGVEGRSGSLGVEARGASLGADGSAGSTVVEGRGARDGVEGRGDRDGVEGRANVLGRQARCQNGVVGEVVDVVIVGAGVMGAAIAWQLSVRGARVVVVEQFELLHERGSSHGASRITRYTYPQDYYTLMMKDAYRLWAEAERQGGEQVFTKTGGLDIGRPDSPAFQAVMQSCEKHGITHQVLTPVEVTERYPSITLPEDYIAVFSPDTGVLNATMAVRLLQKLAREHGVVFHDNTKVLAVSVNEEGSDREVAHTDEGHGGSERDVGDTDQGDGGPSERSPAREGVHVLTDRGTFVGRQCVLSAGAWTRKLVRESFGMDVPTQPLHTTVAYWQCEGESGHQFSAAGGFPVIIDYDEAHLVYALPAIEHPQAIKVSYHSGPPCDPDTRSLDPYLADAQRVVAPWLRRVLGAGVQSDAPIAAQACMYSMTPDEDFIIDFLPASDREVVKSRVLVTAGFSGHGFKMAPVVGHVAASLLLDGSSGGVNIEPFSLQRASLQSA